MHKFIESISFIGKRASVLTAKGAVDIVLKVIINASNECPPNEEVILLGHVLLTKLGPKGKHCTIITQCHALKLFCTKDILF